MSQELLIWEASRDLSQSLSLLSNLSNGSKMLLKKSLCDDIDSCCPSRHPVDSFPGWVYVLAWSPSSWQRPSFPLGTWSPNLPAGGSVHQGWLGRTWPFKVKMAQPKPSQDCHAVYWDTGYKSIIMAQECCHGETWAAQGFITRPYHRVHIFLQSSESPEWGMRNPGLFLGNNYQIIRLTLKNDTDLKVSLHSWQAEKANFLSK